MAYLVGTDEAGYGPNLGPLVISATVWRVDSIKHTDLYSRLRGTVRSVRDASKNGDSKQGYGVLIGDSKELYKPGKGLAGLEHGVLTFLAAIEKRPRTWQRIWKLLANEDSACLAELPWYRDFDDKLPVDLSCRQIQTQAERLLHDCEKAKCVPTQIASRVICPHQFNNLVEQYGNKASALSQTTLGLVRSVLQKLPDDEPVFVLSDKHGGRNKYGPLLNEFFPETLAIVWREGREESAYQLGKGSSRRQFVFRAKADEHFLPSALASMVSKYLRELAMRAFNDFWTSRVQDLKPTAGYPVDAKRFKRQIEPTQKKLGIDDRVLWRVR